MSALTNLNTRITQLTISSARRIRFLEVWCNWLARGYSASQAAEGLAKVYKDQPEGMIAASTYEALASGLTASEGLRGWFPDHLVQAVALYESSGTLVERREEIIARLRKSDSALGTFFSKTGYGMLLIVIVSAMYINVVQGSLIPAMSSIVTEAEWTLELKILNAVSAFLRDYWIALAIGLPALFVANLWVLPNWSGRLRERMDRAPGLYWYSTRSGARILLNLATLVQAGDSWRAAAQRSVAGESPHGRYYLEKFIDALAGGQPVGIALQNMGCLDNATAYQITLLQDDLDLPVMAASIAEEYENDSLKRLALICEGIQLLFFGIVGAAVVLIFAGSYGILQNVSL